MDKLEYIPGDLVMTNGIPIGTKKGIVYQVTESNADKSAKVKDGNAFTEQKGSVTLSNIKGKTIHDEGFLFCDCGAWVKDIVPIPLTVEILKENGWEFTEYYNDEDGFEWFIFSKDGILPDLYYYPADKDFSVFVCREEVSPYLKFVHQLQHLLFGFGLNSEMEV